MTKKDYYFNAGHNTVCPISDRNLTWFTNRNLTCFTKTSTEALGAQTLEPIDHVEAGGVVPTRSAQTLVNVCRQNHKW